MLESFGFSAQAEAVYRALLRDPAADDEQLSRRLEIAAEDVSEARCQLTEAGLLRPSWESESELAFVNPGVLLDTEIRRQEVELAAQQARLAESRSRLSSLVEDYLEATAAPKRRDEVVELVGLDAIRAELENWSHRAQHEVLAVHPQSRFKQTDLASAEALDRAALARGVKMRSVYGRECLSDPGVLAYHRTVARHGAQVRYSSNLPVRMLVFDRIAGIIPMHKADTGQEALLLHGHAVVSMLVLNFDLIWSGAEPSDLRVPGTPDDESMDGPSDIDRVLLQLLSQGVKDEAAARHLGVSVRTVRRHIADLMMRLEAGSRFEAGMQAAMRGWL